MQQFTRCQRKLFLHILAMVGNPLDSEEILQETNVVIWAKYHQFQAGSNLLAWARQIATYEVLKYRDKRRRDQQVFSSEFMEFVAEASAKDSEHQERRRLALFECLKQIPDADRRLIQLRYAPGANGKQVAESLGRPANSVYQSLSRIRHVLLNCVNRRLTMEAGGS